MSTMPTGPALPGSARVGPTPFTPTPAGPPAGHTPIEAAPPGTVPADAVPVPVNNDDPAYWLAKAAAARAKARTLPWESDPELRAQVDMIMSMEPSERIRQLQAQIDLFASAVLVKE